MYSSYYFYIHKYIDYGNITNLKEIKLVPNTKYSDVGGELKTGDGKAKSAILCTAPLYKDNERVELTAYTINNNNYFKLRDIAKLFDIGVTWDAGTKTVGINTAESYVE